MDEQMNRIKDFLAQNGISFDTITKGKQKQLIAIDTEIQRRLQIVEKAKSDLKGAAINVSVISADTNISRKTFYNNDLLRLYVESYVTSEKPDGTASAEELQAAKDKVEKLTEQVNNFVLRDIDMQNLWHENQELMKEINTLKTRCDNLSKENAQLHSVNSQLKAKLPTTIINFNPNESK